MLNALRLVGALLLSLILAQWLFGIDLKSGSPVMATETGPCVLPGIRSHSNFFWDHGVGQCQITALLGSFHESARTDPVCYVDLYNIKGQSRSSPLPRGSCTVYISHADWKRFSEKAMVGTPPLTPLLASSTTRDLSSNENLEYWVLFDGLSRDRARVRELSEQAADEAVRRSDFYSFKKHTGATRIVMFHNLAQLKRSGESGFSFREYFLCILSRSISDSVFECNSATLNIFADQENSVDGMTPNKRHEIFREYAIEVVRWTEDPKALYKGSNAARLKDAQTVALMMIGSLYSKPDPKSSKELLLRHQITENQLYRLLKEGRALGWTDPIIEDVKRNSNK